MGPYFLKKTPFIVLFFQIHLNGIFLKYTFVGHIFSKRYSLWDIFYKKSFVGPVYLQKKKFFVGDLFPEKDTPELLKV